MYKTILVLLFLLLASGQLCPAFTIYHYAPGVFNAGNMTATNTALGVNGYIFEDFTDSTLIPGLTITAISSVNNSWYGTTVTTTTHQGSSTSGIGTSSSASWGGSAGYIYPMVVANIHRFTFAKAVSSFGIGIAEIDDIGGPHAIFINGVDSGLRVENLSSFSRGSGRNAYIRVDAGAGETITSFALQTTTTNYNDVESLFFSHLAFKEDPNIGVVPEGNSLALLCLGLVSILFAIRRKS